MAARDRSAPAAPAAPAAPPGARHPTTTATRSPADPSPRALRPVTTGMRRLLWVAALLVFLAGVQLFVFTERTDRYFAWTVEPPLSAAFLGAAYWSSVGIQVVAARSASWAQARIAVPTVFVFSALTLVVTLHHLHRFHLGDGFELRTQAVTWLWVATYVVVPVVLAVLWVRQAGTAGADPPRTVALPGWLAAVVAVQVVVLLGCGTYLLLDAVGRHHADATSGEAIWPWDLSPLTAQAIGAWLVGLGVAAVHALVERDVTRLRPAAVAYLAFGLLQAVALLRYPGTVAWDRPSSFGYVAFIASAVAVGLVTLALGRRGPGSPGELPHRQAPDADVGSEHRAGQWVLTGGQVLP